MVRRKCSGKQGNQQGNQRVTSVLKRVTNEWYVHIFGNQGNQQFSLVTILVTYANVVVMRVCALW